MDFSKFYERLCQQFPDVGKESGEPILPNKISMKRRLADFYQSSVKQQRRTPLMNNNSNSNNSSNSAGYLWAMDKFRDCVPNLVMVIQKGNNNNIHSAAGSGACVMLEPGKIGPLPMEHPTVQTLVRAVDSKRMSAELMCVLRTFNVPLYDGGAIIGIVDYRKGKAPPSVLKVWLRPTYTSLILSMRGEMQELEGGMSVEMEGKLLECVNPELYLDPEPPVYLGSLVISSTTTTRIMPKYFTDALMSKGESGFDRESSAQGAIPIGKLRRMAALEEYRAREPESTVSADQVCRLPLSIANSSSIATNGGLVIPPPCLLWRTVQWERKRGDDKPVMYWGVNIYVQPNYNNNLNNSNNGVVGLLRMPQMEFLAILWQGEGRADLMQKVERMTFKTVQMVEQFLAQVKKLMHLEDCARRIFNEAINPSALRANNFFPPTTTTTASNNNFPPPIPSTTNNNNNNNTTSKPQNMPKLVESSSSGSSTPKKRSSKNKKE